MDASDVKPSNAKSSKVKPTKADSSKAKPKASKDAKAPATTDSSYSITKPQLKASKDLPTSNPHGVVKTRLVLKKPELKPQHTIRKMLEQAEAAKGAATEGVKNIKEEEKEARHQEEKEAKKIAEIVDPASAQVSRAELERLQNVIISQANNMEEFKETCKKQIKEQEQYIEELVDVLSTLKEAYESLMTAHKSLNRTHNLKPDPLKDEEQRGRCYFCHSSKHGGMICFQFNSAIERRAELEREGRCFVCYTTHVESECPNPHVKRCNCGDKIPHHYEICFTKASKEAVEQRREAIYKRQEKSNGGSSA